MGGRATKPESLEHDLTETTQSVQQNLPSAEVKSKHESAECRAFQKCSAVLSEGISDPDWLAIQLYSRDMISRDMRRKIEALLLQCKHVNFCQQLKTKSYAALNPSSETSWISSTVSPH